MSTSGRRVSTSTQGDSAMLLTTVGAKSVDVACWSTPVSPLGKSPK